MSDRKELTTKEGTRYVLKTRLTRGERRAIEEATYGSMDLSDVPTDGSKPKGVKVDLKNLLKGQEDVLITTIVASINDSPDVLQVYNGLYEDDAEEILEQVNKIGDRAETEKKT